MRNLITLLLALSFFATNAQERKLLKNKAKSTELRQKREIIKKRNSNRAIKTNGRTGIKSNTLKNNRGLRNKKRTINFNYINNYANNQIFVKIPEYGDFGVEINGQYINTYTGKFRFFDIENGTNWISIYENGFLVYKAPLMVNRNDRRFTLEYITRFGLYIISEQPISNWGHNNNSQPWNNNYGNNWNNNLGNNNNWNSNGNSINNGNTNWQNQSNIGTNTRYMNTNEFNQFVSYLKNDCNYDNERIEYINLTRNRTFNTAQIKRILNAFTYDSHRVTAAKKLYKKCFDRDNYYTVLSSFDYSSYKQELRRFIESQNSY